MNRVETLMHGPGDEPDTEFSRSIEEYLVRGTAAVVDVD